jgi:pyruvate, water dikinase
VLVARQAAPRFVNLMTRAAAIVTEEGSVTGHMASLAREYRVPTVTGLAGAFGLAEGAEVTVDASRRRILAGRVEELLELDTLRAAIVPDLPSLARLERFTARIARLNLIDPAKNSFRAKNCRTYHDVVRFCHEMAISEMFNINDYRNLREKGAAFRLDTDVPLGIYVIDLGGGVVAGTEGRSVKPAEIASMPMRALWTGMTTPGVRWAGARPIDMRGFVAAWANTMVDPGRSERGLGDNSYAMVGSDYVNFGSRLGYHFTTLEAVCSDAAEQNYVVFRFKGGAAALERRERRTRFIAEVLLHEAFVVDRQQDLLNAWVKTLPREEIEARLRMLGRLMGCARQLDVAMDTEASVPACVAAFLAADYAFFAFERTVAH